MEEELWPPLREPDCFGILFDEGFPPAFERPAKPEREDDPLLIDAPEPEGGSLGIE